MSIVINLSPEIESQLLKITHNKGVKLESYIQKIIEEKLIESKKRESELLQKINLGVSENTWSKYYQLVDKKNDLTLTELEHQELIQLSNEIEMANANRMKYLVELASLRNVDLIDLIEELGLKVPEYV